MEEIAKEYKVDWVNTDIGLGVPMTAPGIYTDESGNLFLNNRYITVQLSSQRCSHAVYCRRLLQFVVNCDSAHLPRCGLQSLLRIVNRGLSVAIYCIDS